MPAGEELLTPPGWDTFRRMGNDCHRCGSPLASPEMFCPNCGSPQLLYDAANSTGDAPDGVAGPAARDIHWKPAIGAAVTFAVPVGLLCSPVVPILSGGCCLWVVGGAIAAVGLYQRRAAVRALARPVGIRIGTIIGLMAATVACAFNAGALVFVRYVLHGGEAMEKAYQSVMDQVSVVTAQLTGGTPAESHEAMQFLLSADGRAASALLTALMTSAGITVFSIIGGALGTRIFSGRGPSPENP
jgi:hypothetical protein